MRSAIRPAEELVFSKAPFINVRFVRVINCALDQMWLDRRMSTIDIVFDAVHSVDVAISDCETTESNEASLLLVASVAPMVAW